MQCCYASPQAALKSALPLDLLVLQLSAFIKPVWLLPVFRDVKAMQTALCIGVQSQFRRFWLSAKPPGGFAACKYLRIIPRKEKPAVGTAGRCRRYRWKA